MFRCGKLFPSRPTFPEIFVAVGRRSQQAERLGVFSTHCMHLLSLEIFTGRLQSFTTIESLGPLRHTQTMIWPLSWKRQFILIKQLARQQVEKATVVLLLKITKAKFWGFLKSWRCGTYGRAHIKALHFYSLNAIRAIGNKNGRKKERWALLLSRKWHNTDKIKIDCLSSHFVTCARYKQIIPGKIAVLIVYLRLFVLTISMIITMKLSITENEFILFRFTLDVYNRFLA